ncbi:MAG TPA: energy-coupled thiamine transporter ThiT [Bacillota bacterium]|nr:energy-coupled thiamine transporter ThiT [Bacillota bacterium]
MKRSNAIQSIVEAGMMLALATVLGQFIRIFTLPYGGSVTAGSMIPLLLIAMMRGPAVGITVGILYGLIDYSFGGWMVSIVQWLLDYPLAFGTLGLAGVAWNPVRKGLVKSRRGQSLLAVAAAVVGIGGRFLSHFLAGIWFWGSYAPEGVPVWKYSLGYQASYLVPEIILSAIILLFLAPTLMNFLKKRV